jgi:hypothetical protein
VHWLRFDDVLEQAGDLSGKVVLTCSLPMNEVNTELAVGTTSSAAEELAAGLVRDAGFDPIDAGALRIARYTEPFALLMGQLAYEGSAGPKLAYRFEWFRK